MIAVLPVPYGPSELLAPSMDEILPGKSGKTCALRTRAGCWLHERWRTEWALALGGAPARLVGPSWVDLCNRGERLARGSSPESRECAWGDSTYLTVCQVFPGVGARLLRHCLRSHPVRLASEPVPADHDAQRNVSVITPFAGAAREAQFRCVLASLLGQTTAAAEIIVVSFEDRVASLYDWVRWVRVPADPAGFNKSRLLNAAVTAARFPVVLLHDADILVPQDYLSTLAAAFAQGWEALKPIRFLFYLDQREAEAFAASGGSHRPEAVRQVRQNFAGGSTAIRKDAYERIGGHDEDFVGWGGEDVEFRDRMTTLNCFHGGFAPSVHLWHPPAPVCSPGYSNGCLVDQKRAVPMAERVKALRAEYRQKHG